MNDSDRCQNLDRQGSVGRGERLRWYFHDAGESRVLFSISAVIDYSSITSC